MIVLPTFNEALNLPHLVPRLLEQPDVDILIVDDGSPDGTGTWRNSWRISTPQGQRHSPRTKSGRGGAVMAGFRAALDPTTDGSGKWMPTSHISPRNCPPSVAIQYADMVVGARYLPGGDIRAGRAGGVFGAGM